METVKLVGYLLLFIIIAALVLGLAVVIVGGYLLALVQLLGGPALFADLGLAGFPVALRLLIALISLPVVLGAIGGWIIVAGYAAIFLTALAETLFPETRPGGWGFHPF